MGHTGRSIEDGGADNNVYYDGQTQEVSEGKNISKWPKGHFFSFLQRRWLLPALCLKNLPEGKLKTFGLMALAEEISDSSVWSVLCGLSNHFYAELS